MKTTISSLLFAVSLAVTASAQADNVTILQTAGSGTVSYDSTTGLLSATDFPVTASLLPLGTTDNAVFSFSADLDTTGAASVFGGLLQGDDATNVQFSITSGGTNILSGSALTASLVDVADQFSLTAQNPTDSDGVSFTSDVFGPQYNADSLQINFGDSVAAGGGIAGVSGGNFDSFTAQIGTAGFTADVATPLPTSAVAGASLLGALALAHASRKRRGAVAI